MIPLSITIFGTTPRPKRQSDRFVTELKTIPETPVKEYNNSKNPLPSSLQTLHITFLAFALVLAFNSLFVSLNGHLSLSFSFPSSRAIAPVSADTCILVVMMSHPDETEQREFHRNAFSEYHKTKVSADSKTIVRLMFAVPSAAATTTQKSNMRGRKQPSDVIHLRPAATTTREFNADQNYEMLEKAEPELHNGCKRSYLFRAETNYIVNYATLANTINHPWMPANSTYFGSLVTNFPTPHASLRLSANTSQQKKGSSNSKDNKDDDKRKNFFPLFAYGGAYGFSRDMVKQVLSTKKVAQDSSVILPQDRTIGLGIERAHVEIQSPVYLHGIHHLCSADNIIDNCDAYSKFVAFGLPNADGLVTVEQLDNASKDLHMCTLLQRNVDGTQVNNRFFRIQQHGCESDTTALLTSQCAALSSHGQHLENQVQYMMNNKQQQRTTREELPSDSDQKLSSINDEVHGLAADIVRS